MRGHRLHCTGCLSPEGGTKECRLSRHECQAAVEVTLWKGQQANQGYPISNNLQLQRNARHSAAADWPEAAVTWPFDPLQLCEGAITWCLTSLKEWVPVRGAKQEGRRKSESSNINRVPQTKTHDFSFSVCSGFLSFFLFSLMWFLYLPQGKDEASIQGRSLKSWVEVRGKTKRCWG